MEKLNVQRALDGDIKIDISKYIDDAWRLFKPQAGQYIVFLIIVFVIQMIINFIPVLGAIAGQFVSAMLMSGFFIYTYMMEKSGNMEFGNFFKGFNYAGPIILYRLVLIVILLPFLLGMFFVVIPFEVFTNPEAIDPEEIMEAMTGRGLVVMALFFIVAIYISVAYIFVLPLIVIGQLGFWEAMEASRKVATRKFFPVFGFLIVLGLINIVGAIPCGLGLFVTIPLSLIATYTAFKDIYQPEDDQLTHEIENFGVQEKDINTEADEDREDDDFKNS